MINLSTIHQKSTRDSCILSQNWIQIKNISVKRTSGGLKYYQKIVKELDVSKPELNLTGENIMDLIRNFNYCVEQKGPDNYKREILRLCVSKGEMSYYEAKLQFQNDVLLTDDYFNEFIGCKIHSNHVRKT